ncbi:MAG: HAMP domain-containing sensor histidine kinase [Actinomycetota bacterium]|nr:HAMP domain-containing sensor histidine kinase [Actinomycetota bacterium]
MTIRSRIALIFALMAVVFFAVAGTLLYRSNDNAIMNTLKNDLSRSSARIIDQLDSKVIRLRPLVDGPVLVREQEFIQIFDSANHLRYTTQGAGGAPSISLATVESAKINTPSYVTFRRSENDRFLILVIRDDATNNVIAVGGSIDQLIDSRSNILLDILIGLPLTAVLAFLAGYYLAGRALAPVDKLRREAEELKELGEGELLTIPKTRDEIADLAQTLNSMIIDIRKSIAEQKIFIASASHELRTPLARVSADLELALLEGRSLEEIETLIRKADRNIRKLVVVCNSLLTIAKRERDEVNFNLSLCSLDEFISETVEGLRRDADAKSVNLVLDITCKPLVAIDPYHLSRALENIVENALRYSPPDSFLTVSLSLLDTNQVQIDVVDQGPGFPIDFISEALRPFSRSDKTTLDGFDRSSSGGAGLGLSIANMITEMHRGRIKISNNSGGGARVSIILPRFEGAKELSPTR